MLRWGPRRALTLLTVGTTAAVYAVYVAVVAANGYFGDLWQTKTFGIQRMLGLVQIANFNTSGGETSPPASSMSSACSGRRTPS